jgi:prophage regulatory protein
METQISTTTEARKRPRNHPGPESQQARSRAERFIREAECREISGLSRSTRWRLERAGKFPRRRQISIGCTGWLASEVADWLADRKAV